MTTLHDAAVNPLKHTPDTTIPSSARFLTTEEVAAALRAPVGTVGYWRHVGKGPRWFKVGRRALYAREDVEAFITAARAAGSS